MVMRTREDKTSILKLRDIGFNHSSISEQLGIPRPTVRDICKRYADVSQLAAEFDSKSSGCGFESHRQHWSKKQESAYCYLLGMYLGDGYISNSGQRADRLRVTADKKYGKILEKIQKSIESLMPNKVSLVDRKGCFDVSCYSQHWKCLFPQHGKGRKHNREIKLTDSQKILVQKYPGSLVCGLIHSDGCRELNPVNGKQYPRYWFVNRSKDIVDIFCEACDWINVRYRRNVAGATEIVTIATRDNVARLDKIGAIKS